MKVITPLPLPCQDSLSSYMNLAQRVLEGELMDDPSLSVERHERALVGLRRVNLWSGTASVLATAIRNHFLTKRFSSSSPSSESNGLVGVTSDADRTLRVLDLACGGGDVTLQLAKRLAMDHQQVEVIGWDRSPTAIAIAQSSAEKAKIGNVRFEVHDVLADDFGTEFDVIMSTLFLHHLSQAEGTKLLAKMHSAARHLMLIDDLRRTRFGLLLAHVACRILTRSPIVRVDGPMSVRAAFRESEVQVLASEAGLPKPIIQRHWPQRFLLQWGHS